MWVVISRDQCNFCDTAKAMLKHNNQPFVFNHLVVNGC